MPSALLPPQAGPALSRTYVHPACGGSTVVSGDDYVLLECPFRPVPQTLCSACGQFVGLDTVRWADTNERISEYRDKVRASVPWWRQLYLMVFGNAYEGALNLNLDKNGRPTRRA